MNLLVEPSFSSDLLLDLDSFLDSDEYRNYRDDYMSAVLTLHQEIVDEAMSDIIKGVSTLTGTSFDEMFLRCLRKPPDETRLIQLTYLRGLLRSMAKSGVISEGLADFYEAAIEHNLGSVIYILLVGFFKNYPGDSAYSTGKEVVEHG